MAITSRLLRELPTAQIEAAINKRLFAMKRSALRVIVARATVAAAFP